MLLLYHATPVPMLLVGSYAITLWRMSAKLMGNLTLSLLDTPIEDACTIFITLNEMSGVLHHSGLIAIPMDTVASSSIWRKGWP
jgi:hypothetical protein